MDLLRSQSPDLGKVPFTPGSDPTASRVSPCARGVGQVVRDAATHDASGHDDEDRQDQVAKPRDAQSPRSIAVLGVKVPTVSRWLARHRPPDQMRTPRPRLPRSQPPQHRIDDGWTEIASFGFWQQ